MKNWFCYALLMLTGLTNMVNANGAPDVPASPLQIAFLADIHLHDPYQAAEGLNAESLPRDPVTQQPLLLRSMNAQLHSTRLFNENYWVLRAALTDIARRGIKLVALPGDFSDDGQPANVKALNRLLNDYAERYGMRFYAINGNHDPVRPFSRPGGKKDFLAAGGSELAVVSRHHADCVARRTPYCTDELQEWGYAEIADTLSAHGFLPHPDDMWFETPFGTTDFTQRHWQWCDDDNVSDSCIAMPDMSYVAEPVEGIWLLAIDANVYEPTGKLSDGQFKGSGNAGYNALINAKPGLLSWITDVARRARQQHKKLIAFSHFPMADFYDHKAQEMAAIFGPGAMQMARIPSEDTTTALAATGVKLHFAGHMHLYDVAVSRHKNLLNVQVPSLAAYQPGYTVITLSQQQNTAQIDTVLINDVPDFTRWFALYQKEWQARRAGSVSPWHADILDVTSYGDFTDAHLRQVIRQRYLPREWPAAIATLFAQHTINEVLVSTGCSLAEESRSHYLQPYLPMNALHLADDFYRARNAGAMATFSLPVAFYLRMAELLSTRQCSNPTTFTEPQQLRRLLMLISESVTRSPGDPQHIEYAFD
ncbi:metallophosphoesterase family protein [Alteromonas lipolytica]|uniref:Calcineurin-like phosphoesterase domain-containing protein n=1 Tax=Alteromonas lipolytica TaxID=1856405 RepID=A0A1E8F8N9_9ALTE|nr:metallophosphoesterase [Alteromonas lipolytica]OFI32284.1 hypothetical protein BFC17_07480 [Alteromonas lipolytica]GGF85809.1 metallophosphoesterase [Alteromonas lipolytica]